MARTAKQPTYTTNDRTRIAEEMTADAGRHNEAATRLDDKGKTDAADRQRRGAETRRQIATAARTGNDDALNTALGQL